MWERRRDFHAIANHFSRRSFPESTVRELGVSDVEAQRQKFVELGQSGFTLVHGFPSPKDLDIDDRFAARDDHGRVYASLNDVIEPFVGDGTFVVVFSLRRAFAHEVVGQFKFLSDLRTTIGPHLKQQVSEGHNEGQTQHRDRSRSRQAGKSQAVQPHLLNKLRQFLLGHSEKQGLRQRAGTTFQSGTTDTTTEGESVTLGRDRSVSLELRDSALEFIDRSLERTLEHLQDSIGTGAFRGCVCVYSNDRSLRQRVGRAAAATLGGPHSALQPFQVISCEGDSSFHFRDNLNVDAVVAGLPLLSTPQASRLLLVPEAEVPGIQLKRNVFYGRAPRADAEIPIVLGTSAFSVPSFHRVTRGRAGFNVPDDSNITVEADDLLGHVLVTGATGSGKTVRALDILNRLPRDRFRLLVIETAKSGFRSRLRRDGREPRVLALGGGNALPFRINPFFIDRGASLKRHISVFADAISDLLPMEALIGPKLREAIMDCYAERGFDVERDRPANDGPRHFPTMLDLARHVKRIVGALNYSPELNQNYEGALTGRVRIFLDDLYQDIFAFDGEREIGELLDEDTIIEMEGLPPSEIEMPAFVTALLLERLRAHSLRVRRNRGAPATLVVIEEAHNILSREHDVRTSMREANGGKQLLDQAVRLLQEGRELGIGVVVIDQSPSHLAEAVVKNTNTKIVCRLVDGDEIAAIAPSLGLDQEEALDLAHLEDGEAVVKLKRAGKSVKLAPVALPPPVSPACEWSPQPLPHYAQADSVLSQLARTPSLEACVEAERKLRALDEALPDAERLLRHHVGRFLFKHNLLENGAIDDRSIAWMLAAPFRSRISASQGFCTILMQTIDGRQPDLHVVMLGDRIHGVRWLERVAEVLNVEMNVTSETCGCDGQVVALLHRAISTWAAELGCGSHPEQRGEIRNAA